MLRQIVKIANKLDSLGLTKEADILDRYIQKMATGPATVGQSNVIYDDQARAQLAPGAALAKFYRSTPATLSEFNGLLGRLVEEVGKIPGQNVFSKEVIDFPPKEGDTTWSGATKLAFREYAEAAGFQEAGISWKDFALKNRYQPTLFGIYKFWENTIGKVLDKAKSGFSTTLGIGEKVEGELPTFADISPSPAPSPSAQASSPATGGTVTPEEKAMPAYRAGPPRQPDATIPTAK